MEPSEILDEDELELLVEHGKKIRAGLIKLGYQTDRFVCPALGREYSILPVQFIKSHIRDSLEEDGLVGSYGLMFDYNRGFQFLELCFYNTDDDLADVMINASIECHTLAFLGRLQELNRYLLSSVGEDFPGDVFSKVWDEVVIRTLYDIISSCVYGIDQKEMIVEHARNIVGEKSLYMGVAGELQKICMFAGGLKQGYKEEQISKFLSSSSFSLIIE